MLTELCYVTTSFFTSESTYCADITPQVLYSPGDVRVQIVRNVKVIASRPFG